MRSVLVLVVLAWSLAACDDTVMVQIQSGPQRVEIDAAALGLPAALRDESDGEARIASLECGPMGLCPSSDAVAITCEAGVCDPAPSTLTAPLGDVIDVDALIADARGLLGRIDAIEIAEASYDVPVNTLSVTLPPLEVFWGPEGAAHVDPEMGVVALGTVPAIAASTEERGQVVLDADGVDALSRYLVRTSRRVRFFARTRVDLAPGERFPEGAARVTIDLRVRIIGSIR